MDSAFGIEEGGTASEEEGTVRPIRTGKAGWGRLLIGATVRFGILTLNPWKKIVGGCREGLNKGRRFPTRVRGVDFAVFGDIASRVAPTHPKKVDT